MAGKDTAQVQGADGEGVDHDEEIRRRAHEISQSEESGTPEENWQRAEREVAQRASTAPNQG